MSKSPDAFRTISEVADWLGIQAHVLRFWESKFNQVKPVKRAGGRRYYRPADMELLGGIRKLLHDDGMTIKGVQKVLREQGVAHVSALSQPLDNIVSDEPELDATDATVLHFKSNSARVEDMAAAEAHADALFEEAAASEPEPEPEPEPAPELPSFLHRRQTMPDDAAPEAEPALESAPDESPEPESDPTSAPDEAPPSDISTQTAPDPAPTPEPEPEPEPEPAPEQSDAITADTESPAEQTPAPAPEPEEETGPLTRIIDAPDPPETDAIPYTPGLLAHLAKLGDLTPEQARAMAPELAALRAWADRAMASPYS